MRELRNILISLNKGLKKIKLIDRCLIIFMIILMSESIYNLFSNRVSPINSNDIDIIIRTTSAAIFGYFLSGNFIKKPRSKDDNCSKQNEILDKKTILPYEEIDTIEEYDKNIKELNASNQQIIIATIIGITALVVLIIARNYIELNDKSIAVISQMRDFVSGCVGFLLGCPTKVNK